MEAILERCCGHPLIVKLQGKEFPMSTRFVYDVVYGFETVESCIEGLFGFADSLLDVDISEFGPLKDSKPIMHTLSSLEAAIELASSDQVNDDDFITPSPLLIGQLEEKMGRRLIPEGFLRTDVGQHFVFRVEDIRRWLDSLDSDNLPAGPP